ncbi:hypothetical protein V8E53_003989 [Lactarius tabidus]
MSNLNASLKDPTLVPTQLPPTRAIMDGEDDCVTPSSKVCLTRPSSQASAWSRTRSTSKGLDGVHDVWPPGAFDDDEDLSTLQAAQTAKKTKPSTAVRAHPLHPTESQPTASYTSNRTTNMVGPAVKKKDIHSAAYLKQHAIVKSEGHEYSKRYQQLKVADIPITEDCELVQWDLIVCGVLDWAGTLPDTFGTNEHLDLLDTIQDLWDKCLPERAEDVHDNPAVKKVIIDRLNEWRSAIGKKAITIISDYIKNNNVLRRDQSQVAKLVKTMLPFLTERPVSFPLIYSDPKALKGSWLVLLLLQVFAVHLRRVTKAPSTFGYPTGALALSTAALERALMLFQTGVNIRDEKPTNPGTRGFDNSPWGGIACQYAQSTCELPKCKWEQIMCAASTYITERAIHVETRASAVVTDGRSRIVVSDDDDTDILGVEN